MLRTHAGNASDRYQPVGGWKGPRARMGELPEGLDTCPVCELDAFGCECTGDDVSYSADDVRQAVADADAKRAKAVGSERVALGLAKDRAAEVARLTAALAEAEARCVDLVARAEAHPGERNETRARLAGFRVEGSKVALARAEAVDAGAPVPVPMYPGRLGEYLGRLEDPPRISYAQALAAALLAGEDGPDAVDAPWFAKVDAKVRRLALPHVDR